MANGRKKSARRLSAGLAVLLAIVLFFGVNIASQTWLRSARLDLTENGLYTLSPGTKAVLAKLEEPITLRFYFSRRAAADYAQVLGYGSRVRDLLQEYAAISGGKVILEEIDPEPFTPAEDDAVAQGLSGAPTQDGQTVYFGLVGTNTLDGKQTIAYFAEDREEYLEYDVSSLIYRLSTPEKPKLGVMSNIPLEAGAAGPMAALQGQAQPFVAFSQLREVFDIEPIQSNSDRIPADVNTLMLVHPATLPPETLYAVDQFVMRGGRLLLFVDPLSEVLWNQTPIEGAPQTPLSSNLDPLLNAWGVAYDPSHVLGDGTNAQRVRMGGDPNQQADYLVWLRLVPENFNKADPLSANLQQLNLASVGVLVKEPTATTTFTPLIESSTDTTLFDATMVRNTRSPQDLLATFKPSGVKYAIAARITGPAKSAYPSGAPARNDNQTDEKGPLPAPITSADSINVVVVADTDIFDDRFWVQQQNMLGQRMAVPTADNGALVLNAAENLMGSNDLLSLRTRARSDRPFTVVDNLRRQAESQFLAQEQQLQKVLTDTQNRLRALQDTGSAGETSGEVLAGDQQSEVEEFRKRLVDTRTALRDVQANLRRDVEALGTRLAVINIVGVPVLVAIAAILLAVFRRRRRVRARAVRAGG